MRREGNQPEVYCLQIWQRYLRPLSSVCEIARGVHPEVETTPNREDKAKANSESCVYPAGVYKQLHKIDLEKLSLRVFLLEQK